MASAPENVSRFHGENRGSTRSQKSRLESGRIATERQELLKWGTTRNEPVSKEEPKAFCVLRNRLTISLSNGEKTGTIESKCQSISLLRKSAFNQVLR